MLQLLDVLRGGGQESISAAYLAVGADTAAKIVQPRISRVGTAKRHFSRLMARPLAAKALKKDSKLRSVFA